MPDNRWRAKPCAVCTDGAVHPALESARSDQGPRRLNIPIERASRANGERYAKQHDAQEGHRLKNVSRVEYMLSTEATIAGEDVLRQGESVEIPVNDSLLLKVWNTPRADRNHWLSSNNVVHSTRMCLYVGWGKVNLLHFHIEHVL